MKPKDEQKRHARKIEAVVWPWREVSADNRRSRSTADRKRRSLIESAVALVAGLVLLFLLRRPVMASIALTVAFVTFVGGQFIPRLYDAFRLSGVFLGRIAGTALSWALLAPFFYICFTFGRLVLLLTGRDPMKRQFPAVEETCWTPHAGPRGKDQYRKQH